MQYCAITYFRAVLISRKADKRPFRAVLISRMHRGAKFRPAAIEMTALWDKVNWLGLPFARS